MLLWQRMFLPGCNWRINKRWCVITGQRCNLWIRIKIEGVPESNVNRDLFEGLVIGDLNGHPVPGVAESWDNKDF